MGARPLVVGIADLRRQPGTRRQLQRGVTLDGLVVSSARVPDRAEIGLDLELEALSNGLVATGTVTVPWEGECRRCLREVRSESVAEVREIFEPSPVEGETYPLGDDLVDLPVLRACGLAFTVPDAPAEVKRSAHHVTRRRGGEGAVRDACETLMRLRSRQVRASGRTGG